MKFKIGFEEEDKKTLFEFWDDIIKTGVWASGKYLYLFERTWHGLTKLYSVAFNGWSGAALAALEYFGIKNKTVMIPANTMIATTSVCRDMGNELIYVDCNKNDLCMSFKDMKEKAVRYFTRKREWPAAVFVVHIGGHIAFDILDIAAFCEIRGIRLFEDCAHAHGATALGRSGGSFGEAGFYSFYATKTISTGEGGMLVTRHSGLAKFGECYRNYGRTIEEVQRIHKGQNYCISEFTAALGYVVSQRLEDIVNWKREYAKRVLDPKFEKRVVFPHNYESGFYKYIVFEPIERSTGRVYERPVFEEEGIEVEGDFPNTRWVNENHWCVPIYYKGE